MATIGQALTAPEAGWKRYDDRDPAFVYSGGTWVQQLLANHYQSTLTYTNTIGAKISFKFTGTKIRLILDLYTDNDTNSKVTIDGVTEVFSQRTASGETFQALGYEKTNLPPGEHVVVLENGSGGTFRFDAVDIDSASRVLHPNEVTDIKYLAVGKRIRCNYNASTSGKFGVLSGLGSETNTLMAPAPTATPNGDFYFMMVEDSNGIKYLVADRNIQHSISWDTLNAAGVASGNGWPVFTIVRIGLTYKVIYVDPTVGVDTNNGSSSSPLKGLNAAISLATTNTAIKLSAGVHTIDTATKYLHDLCTTKGISFVGEGLSTILEVPACPTSLAQAAGTSAYFYNMVIRPTISPTGDQRAIWYNSGSTAANFKLRFKNVTFTKAVDGSNHPSQWYFSWSNSGSVNPDAQFENCSLATVPGSPEALSSAVVRFINSAFGNASTLSLSTTSLFSATFDANMNITSNGWIDTGTGSDPDGSVANIGVYGGQLKWGTYAFNIGYYALSLRLPTGGTISTDTDDEWDNYIVNSSLGGLITPGDNTVWNWSGAYSWTSTTTNASTSRAIRGNTAAATYTNSLTGTVATTTAFRPILVIDSTITFKHLFEDGTDIKRFTSPNWIVVGTSPATSAMFDSNGMESGELALLTNTNIQQLVSSSPKLLTFIKGGTVTPTTKLTAIPANKVVFPTGDINLSSVMGVDYFNIVVNELAGGVVRLIVSVDSGTTWKTWNGGWVSIAPSDLTAVKTNGITASTVNARVRADWDALINGGNTIRFAYYLEIAATTDIANTDVLTMQVDMQGSWKKAIHGTDYDYEYPDNNILKMQFFANGDFKVNY